MSMAEDRGVARSAAVGAAPVARMEHRRAADRVAQQLQRPSAPPIAFSLLAALLDSIAVVFGLWFAAYASAGGDLQPGATMLAALAAAAVAVAVLLASGSYDAAVLARTARSTALAWVAAAVGALAALPLGQWPGGASGFAVIGAAFVGAGLLLTHAIIGVITRWARDFGLTARFAVLVGGGPEGAGVLDAMHEAGSDDIRVVGLFDDRVGARSPDMVRGVPKLGRVADLIPFARTAHIDLVIIAFPLSATARIREVAELLRVLPMDIRLSGYTQSVAPARTRAPQVTGDRLIALADRPLAGAAALSKRLLDIVLAGVALVALSPLMLIIAASIRLDSPGPVFFRQRRHGYNHSEIEILKFRSMHADAADTTARRVVTRGDPRVTRVGGVLRRCSLDELPQLINVLRGDLSLVGPRPHVVDAVYSERTPFEEIVDGYAARHRVPPGITGWAQVNGWRGEIDDPERLLRRVEHDLYYIENRTLWFDLYILLRTVPALFRTDYAY